MKPTLKFLLFGLILAVFFSSGQIENPDTHLRLTQSRILLESGQFGLPDDVGEELHGNIAVSTSGRRHMVYNPGQTLFFTPFYALLSCVISDEGYCYYTGAFIVSFLNFLLHTLSLFYVFRIAINLGTTKKRALLLCTLFGLTSYSFAFAQSTYEHHFEMLFILMSVYQVLSGKKSRKGLASGLLLSAGLVFRSTTIFAVPAILILHKNNSDRLKMFAGLSVGLATVLAYNYYRFGGLSETGYSIAWSLAHRKELDFWSVQRVPESLLGLLFSPAKGLFFFSPTILLASMGWRQGFWQNHRRLSYAIFILSGVYLLVISMNFAWHGSIWSYGPRYILPILPFLYLPIIAIEPKRWMFRTAIFAFLGQVLLISVNYKRDVLEEYVQNKNLSEIEYLWTPEKIPYLSQAGQLVKVIPRNVPGNLESYQPDSPWKKEVRTGNSFQVLENSIEKTAINFWWIRVFQWDTSVKARLITIAILLLASFASYKLWKDVKTFWI